MYAITANGVRQLFFTYLPNLVPFTYLSSYSNVYIAAFTCILEQVHNNIITNTIYFFLIFQLLKYFLFHHERKSGGGIKWHQFLLFLRIRIRNNPSGNLIFSGLFWCLQRNSSSYNILISGFYSDEFLMINLCLLHSDTEQNNRFTAVFVSACKILQCQILSRFACYRSWRNTSPVLFQIKIK